MRHYCTLFDKNYLTKGLCLYQSLIKHSTEDFRLWVLPLDGDSLDYLINNSQALSKINFIRMKHMPEDILRQRKERPWNYYCFGLAPELTLHLMYDLKQDITYLDADTYFYQDPKLVFDDMRDKEVGIVSHNFPKHDYNRLIGNGKFNVSLVAFKYTPASYSLLRSWRDGVRIQCDQESCGDQRYLDLFPDVLGDKLHIFDGKRIGAGPWNVYTYKTESGPKVDGQDLIYYHFHELKVDGLNTRLTGYPLSKENKEFIYVPYLRTYEFIEKSYAKSI